MSMLIIIKYMYIDNYQHAHIIFKLLKLIAWHLNFIYKSRNKENIFDKLKAQLPNSLLSVNVIGLHLTTKFTKTITVSFDCHFIYIFSFDIKIHLTIFFLQNVYSLNSKKKQNKRRKRSHFFLSNDFDFTNTNPLYLHV